MKKIVIFVLIILVVIVAVVYFLRSSKVAQGPTQESPTQMPSAQQTVPPTASIQPTIAPTAVASPKTTPKVTSAKTYNVSAVNFSFDPGVLNISKGDTVVWTNQDSVPHQIAGGTFNGPVMGNGQSYTFTFNSTGTFNYHCAIHPSMLGTIIVK